MTPIPQPLPLEDHWNDVLGKAVRGTAVDDKNLAASANLIPAKLKSILGGELPSEDALRRLAVGVGLRPAQLVDLAFKRYKPKNFDSSRWIGVLQIPTQYMDMVVNSYLLWDAASKEAVLCDTGTDLAPIRKALDDHQLKLTTLLITHTHGDHVAILDEVMSNYHPQLFAPKGEPVPGATLIEEGAEIKVGSLKAQTFLVDGHSPGHLAYVFKGPSAWPAPVAVVGDALFAGSMGGGAVSYERLRNNMQTKLLSLPPETLVCPGHGPTTTVGEEREHNPFG